MEILISTDAWETVEVDAFVCPTNSEGIMSHYPASKIKKLVEEPVEQLVVAHTPLATGAALVTPAGKLRAQHLIHVPNCEKPGARVQVEDISRATAAALIACDRVGARSVAIPLMGAFDSGIPAEEAARAIHSACISHKAPEGFRVLLMARDRDEYDVFELALQGVG